jgi:hypothetical protein
MIPLRLFSLLCMVCICSAFQPRCYPGFKRFINVMPIARNNSIICDNYRSNVGQANLFMKSSSQRDDDYSTNAINLLALGSNFNTSLVNVTFINHTNAIPTVSTAAASVLVATDQLSYLQTMTAGAVSRTMAQTLLHPAHTYKTLLQLKDKQLTCVISLQRLLRGVDAQFLLSLPHGAFHFFVIDQASMYVVVCGICCMLHDVVGS